MKSSQAWLLNNIFRDAAESIWQYKLANPNEAIVPMKAVALSSISTTVTLQLMKKLGIKEEDLTSDEFKKLKKHVIDALSGIDFIISDKIETEYNKRTKQNPELLNNSAEVYKAIIIKAEHIIPTKTTRLYIDGHLDDIYEMGKVKDKLDPMLAKRPETVKAKATITKSLSDKLSAEQSTFTDKPRTSSKEGVSEGYIAKGTKPENLDVTFMLKNTLLKPDQVGPFNYRVNLCVMILVDNINRQKYGWQDLRQALNDNGVDTDLFLINPTLAITEALKTKHPNGEEGRDTVKLFLDVLSAQIGAPLFGQADLTPFKVYNVNFATGLAEVSHDFRNNSFDAMNFFNEFLTAPIYEKILFDRTPVIAGVKATKEEEVLLRSKFLPGFKTASQHTGGAKPNIFGAGNFADVAGAAKLMAALLAGGEFDIHAGNFGVMKESSRDETTGQDVERSVFSKIDHGWSATQLFTNGEAMWKNFNNACTVYGYKSNIDINLKEFRESLDQILKLSPSYIEDQVKARMYQLKAMGFNPIGLVFSIWTDDIKHNYEVSKPAKFKVRVTIEEYNAASESQKKLLLKEAYNELENLYTDRFKNHWKALAEFRDLAEVAEKLCKANGEEPQTDWNKGKWINHLNGKNPILYALEGSLKIKEKDSNGVVKYTAPLLYAIERGMKIEGAVIAYAISQNLRFQAKDVNGVIKQIDILDYAIEKGIEINGRKAIEYAIANNLRVKRVDSAGVASYIDPLLYAIEKDIEIYGQKAIEYAAENNKSIIEIDSNGLPKGKNPLDYAVDHNIMSDGRSVIELAIIKGYRIHELDATIYAICYGININGMNAIDFAISKSSKIDNIEPTSFKADIDRLNSEQFKELGRNALAAVSLPIPEHLQPTPEIVEVPVPPSPAKPSSSMASLSALPSSKVDFIEKIKSQHNQESPKAQHRSYQKSSFSNNILNERQDAGKSKSPTKDL